MVKQPSVTQLYKGTIELAVLALLSRRAHYGGEIVDKLASIPGLHTSAGTIYPLLKRLAKAGALSTSWVESPSGPPRKYYKLTPTGKQDFAALSAAWHELAGAITMLLEATDD
ncbi:MAG: PadR family transcriptional regulator [Actinomycetaceae bacterium]|nr:PadR family transcriptional regulator [Actinomycetaceae bacterium]